jgi:hypothetical protein
VREGSAVPPLDYWSFSRTLSISRALAAHPGSQRDDADLRTDRIGPAGPRRWLPLMFLTYRSVSPKPPTRLLFELRKRKVHSSSRRLHAPPNQVRSPLLLNHGRSRRQVIVPSLDLSRAVGRMPRHD